MKKSSRTILIVLSSLGVAAILGFLLKNNIRAASWTFYDIVHPTEN